MEEKIELSNTLEQEYKKSLDFWNEWLGQDEEIPSDTNMETAWKEIGSKDLADVVATFSSQKNVLDYGCGSGWASVIMVKSGCSKVTAVDISENGIKASKKYASAFHANDAIEFHPITTDWMKNQTANQFDGFFCCNVLDVVPRAISENILMGAAQVCQSGAKIVLVLNPYFEEEYIKKSKLTVKDGNHLFMDGILRVVNFTDAEWTNILESHFEVQECRHFRWDGEADTVNRRIFILHKK